MKSDSELKQDLLDELSWDPSFDASNIGVIVQDGAVTLAGYLGSYAEKYAAEKAALRVHGVRALATELKVQPATPSHHTDPEIAGAARHALQWNALVPDTVQAEVEKGWVTLMGEVQWDYQRQAAERAIRGIEGVVEVNNTITVRPAAAAGDIKQGIKQALDRQARKEADRIEVLVDGTSVTLRGEVDSLAAMSAVVGTAWSAPGATSVCNELKVQPESGRLGR